MLYNPPSGDGGSEIPLPNVRDDQPRAPVAYTQSSVFTPPTHQTPLPQVQQQMPFQQHQPQVQNQIPIDPALLDIPSHPMVQQQQQPQQQQQQHQQMLHAPGANFHPNGSVSDYGGLQSAAMQSGNWQQNVNLNPNGSRGSPPDLSYSRSSYNASGTDLVASPTRGLYYANQNQNGSAPLDTSTTSINSTLGLDTTTKSQSEQLEVDVSQQSNLSVDEDSAGIFDGNDRDGPNVDFWADGGYAGLDDQGNAHAGPSTFIGAYDESIIGTYDGSVVGAYDE